MRKFIVLLFFVGLLVSCNVSMTGKAISELNGQYDQWLVNNTKPREHDVLTSRYYFLVNGTTPPVEESAPQSVEDIPEALSQDAKTDEELQEIMQDPNTVRMRLSRFGPTPLHIPRGETVTWINDDTKVHIISMYGKEFKNSQKLNPGDTFSYAFHESGSFPYQDAILLDKMTGEIIVGP